MEEMLSRPDRLEYNVFIAIMKWETIFFLILNPVLVRAAGYVADTPWF
jgi:hypothetical protein